MIKYAQLLVAKAGQSLQSGEIFAKVLTANDDSGRHGILIPSDVYSYFPDLEISNTAINKTIEFKAFDAIAGCWSIVAYKYYQRYPERRITRLNGFINDRSSEPRIFIALKAKHKDGSTGYYFDGVNAAPGGRFNEIFDLIFGSQIKPIPGNFVVRPVDSGVFCADDSLTKLLERFDAVKALGWIETMRAGDTGIGYTFETLLGIKENNDQIADFHGIEIKCKGRKPGKSEASSKINLFQAGPTWLVQSPAKERIRVIGRMGPDGLYACYSQVTTTPNNIGLLLNVSNQSSKIDLLKNTDELGFWSFSQLENRLKEKHSRTAFIKADIRNAKGPAQFSYNELVYCDKPSIGRFMDLVSNRNIVFEFTISEKSNGSIRNHGYPWRLIRSEFLDQLFAFQVKLR
jgi:hypothetical protein